MIHKFGLILAILLCSGYAHAQQTTSAADNPQATDTALRKKAFSLLESVAGQLNGLQSAENRARLGANIADSLWKHDEKRARDLFVLVEQDIKTGLANCDVRNPEDTQTLAVFLKLRADTIERIAKHDAELALSFLQATKFTSDRPLPYGVGQNEDALELRLAKQIAADNPDVAVKLGLQSLEEGFSQELLSLLQKLSRKHKEPAQILYKEIVKKLRDVDFAQQEEVWYFTRSLTETFTPPAADNSTYRELINSIISDALANGCGKKATEEYDRTEFCRWAAATVTPIGKIDPRVGQLKHWAPEVEEWNTRYQPLYELNDLVQEGTVDEILALEKEYPERAEEIYFQAIYKARALGDLEQARKIATDRITDPVKRQLVLTQLSRQEGTAIVDDENLAKVQTTVNKIPQLRDRVMYLLSAANEFGGTDRNLALKFLNQASEIIDTMKPGKDQTQTQIALAIMFCFKKSDRGFAIMESLVPKLNELVEVAAKLDKYDTNYLRDGEWNMSASGSIGETLTYLAQHAAYFAWCDFDRAVNLAGQFDRTEIRLMAQVKLAQGILAGPPKRIRIEYWQSYN